MNHQAWLTLAHAYVSVAESLALEERFGDVDNIVSQSEQALRDAGLPEPKAKVVSSPDPKKLEAAMLWLDAGSHHILAYGGDAYPELSVNADMGLSANADMRRLGRELPFFSFVMATI